MLLRKWHKITAVYLALWLFLVACGGGATLEAGTTSPTTAAQPTPLPDSLPFAVIQAGAPTNGDPQPLFVALRGDLTGQSAPPGLPAEARQALDAALAEKKAGLILVLYAGEMPSSGFSILLEDNSAGQENGQEVLNVSYSIQPPDPQSGAAAVLTYPYLIARLDSTLAPEQVRFEKSE